MRRLDWAGGWEAEGRALPGEGRHMGSARASTSQPQGEVPPPANGSGQSQTENDSSTGQSTFSARC